MKTKLLFLAIFCITQFNYSQTTYVPDDNFEQHLIDIGRDSGALDNFVLTANINTITLLDVSNKNISDLTGIEDFAALISLKCYNNNNLTSLNVSSNTMLTSLETYSTNLSSLVVSNNSLLVSLNCANNQLTSLDVSLNPSLIVLSCQNNQLTTLNAKNGNNTNLTNFNASANSGLTCIKVDDPAYSTTNWTNIDATTSFDEFCTYQLTMSVTGSGSTVPNSGGIGINYPLVITAIPNSGWQFDNWSGDFSSTVNPTSLIMDSDKNIIANFSPTVASTYIPDDNFEQALIDLGYDSILDNYVVKANINTVTVLDVSNKNISDLTGIEDFTALTNLNCSFNQLTSLNVSAITGLDTLFCFFNQLSNINVSNTSLTTLYCNNNELMSIDISSILLLENLFCNDNLITILDVSVNTQLTNLRCYNNASLTHLIVTNNTLLTSLHTYNTAQSASLDVSNNTALTDLRCANSQLIGLNIKNGNNTNIISFDATNNPSLTCIDVDDVAYATANFTNNIDATASFSTDCNPACVITIPDANFKAYLLGEAVINTNGDSEIQCSEASAFTGTIDVNSLSISDLTGIEAFTALTQLVCYNNSLTSLNVLANTALINLTCYNNQLTSLNLTQNTALAVLWFNNNFLTSLDVSQNTALAYLYCQNNSLASLNVANGNNTNFVNFYATNNPNLTCIEVDDVAYSTTNWTNIDATANFSTDCSAACIVTIPDANFKTYLVGEAAINTNGDSEIQCNEASAFTGTINVSNLSISDLTGIEAFTALTYLYCYSNSLTSLDVSQNTALERLYCSGNLLTTLDVSSNVLLKRLQCYANFQLASLDLTTNVALTNLHCYNTDITSLDLTTNILLQTLQTYSTELTSLDLSNNIALTNLSCDNNQITSLDLSAQTVLTSISCSNNALASLNIKNGNNTNITTFDVSDNPNLTCIEVDDATYSTANWTNIDAQTSFSTNCVYLIQFFAKAYLQGAATNPNAGEETWMRDDLRVASLIPTTSPYTDALTCNASVFTPTGANAIVDWVWVELRDENDNTNILASTSALLQRDGDIVATDGISPISFSLSNGNYYVAITHRNHLGILSANTFALSSTVSVVDLSNSFAVINGGVNAVVDLGNGIFACYAGDYDGNDQIQNTDVNSVVSLLGNSGYSNADTDLNGQTQNTDINILINPNIGKGQQYLREQLNLYAKRMNRE